MWWSSRAHWMALPVLVGALAGCGFRPLYATGDSSTPGGSVATELAAVEVAPIPDRTGQELRNRLDDLLDPGRTRTSPRYRLKVDLDEELDEFAIERSGFATRRNIRIEADYALTDATSGRRLLAGSSRTTSGFDIVQSEFSTLTAEETARSRIVRQIAHDIRRRLGAHFAGQPRAETPAASIAP